MGIYDRDYYRPERSGVTFGFPQSMVGRLVLLNVALWAVDGLVTGGWITQHLRVSVGALGRPWEWWQFLTYGFVHAASPEHVLFNMFTLWVFGVEIEAFYGSKEFLRLYLVLLLAGSVGWAVLGRLSGVPLATPLEGASGAVVGVFLLFVLHFPRRTLLFMFVFPMPAWILGVILIGGDVLGAVQRSGSNVAYSVHLIGAGLAFLYYRFGWNFGRLGELPGVRGLTRPRRDLRIHQPEPDASPDDEESPDLDALGAEVDRILEKIHLHGEASLTRKERQSLESASREYQRRRRATPQK